MRKQCLFTVLLFMALAPGSGQEADQPDAIALSGNSVSSPFFKFHYSFPQGWSPQKEELRMEKNRKRHEDAVNRAKTDASRTVNTRGITTTTRVFWTYDLLFATPPGTPEGKLVVPYAHVWAMECSNITNQPGDYAKLMQSLDSKQLGKTESKTIAGHKFMRSSFLFEGEHFPQKQFETMFETLSGRFLLIFEFHGKTEQEMNELAKTMESVTFDDWDAVPLSR